MTKQGARGPASKGRATSGRRRKASRPPVIDLEALDVSSKQPGSSGPKSDTTATDTGSRPANEPSKGASSRVSEKPGGKAPPPPPPPPRSDRPDHQPPAGETVWRAPSGVGQLVLAAGAGALIFLIAVLAVRLTEQGPSSAGDGLTASLDRLGAKMDLLEKSAAEGAPSTGRAVREAGDALAAARRAQDTAGLAQRNLKTIEARLEILAKTQAGAPSGDMVAVLTSRLDGIEATATALSTELAEARSRQSDLETALTTAKANGSGLPAALTLQLKEHAAKLDRLEQRLAVAKRRELAAARVGEDLKKRVAVLSGTIAELNIAPGRDMPGELARLNERLAPLEAALKSLSQTVKSESAAARQRRDQSQQLAARLAAGEKDIAALRKTRLAAASLLVGRVEGAVRSGTPFADDLAILSALVPGLAGLDALTPLARGGTPSRARINAGFLAISGKLGSARTGGDQVDNLMARLVAHAGTIVKVRRGNRTLSDASPSGPAGEIAARLRAGDLPGALRAGLALDAEKRKIAAAWLGELAKVAAAEAAIGQARAWLRAGIAGDLKPAPAGNGKAE